MRPLKTGRGAAMESERVKTAEAPPAAGTPSSETQSRPQPAATGLLDRLRQEFTEDVEEARIREKSNAPKRLGGLLDRFRRTANEQAAKWKPRASSSKPKGGQMAALSPNDLRHYLTQRIAASEVDEPAEISSKPKSRAVPAGPVLKSLDTVLDKVLDAATGGLPRALLVAGTSSGADADQGGHWACPRAGRSQRTGRARGSGQRRLRRVRSARHAACSGLRRSLRGPRQFRRCDPRGR